MALYMITFTSSQTLVHYKEFFNIRHYSFFFSFLVSVWLVTSVVQVTLKSCACAWSAWACLFPSEVPMPAVWLNWSKHVLLPLLAHAGDQNLAQCFAWNQHNASLKYAVLGEMQVPGNLLKNVMYSSVIEFCISSMSHPFAAKGCVWDSCVWTTEYRDFSVLKSLQMSFAIAWQSLSWVVSAVFLTTLSQMCSYAAVFRYLWQWLPTNDLPW